jgi:cell shape-determining protein MreC
VVEKALSPFVAKLEETLKENGRLEAELRAAREELATLKAKPSASWWRRLLFGSAA